MTVTLAYLARARTKPYTARQLEQLEAWLEADWDVDNEILTVVRKLLLNARETGTPVTVTQQLAAAVRRADPPARLCAYCPERAVGRFCYDDGGGYENSKSTWMCANCQPLRAVGP